MTDLDAKDASTGPPTKSKSQAGRQTPSRRLHRLRRQQELPAPKGSTTRDDRLVNNEWKYNLSYLSIDLRNHAVYNADGASVTPPWIWTTQKPIAGFGIPHGEERASSGHLLGRERRAFLPYVLSGKHPLTTITTSPQEGRWKQTLIRSSNNQWNSGYLSRRQRDSSRLPDRRRGVPRGRIHGQARRWPDRGMDFRRQGQFMEEAPALPDQKPYQGWRFNNVQPVVRPDGSIVEGMLLFYGWKDKTFRKPPHFCFMNNLCGSSS